MRSTRILGQLLWLVSAQAAMALEAAEPTMDEFLPPAAVQPFVGEGHGRLKLQSDEAEGFAVVRDSFGYDKRAGASLRVFPAATFEWEQKNGAVVPVVSRVQSVRHPNWEIAFQAGRVWQRDGHPKRYYAVPFALLEKNANCTHNGMLRWTVDEDGQSSVASYLIASETCAYFKFDMWGRLQTEFTLNAADARVQHADEYLQSRAARLPVVPVSAIKDDFPKVDADHFGAVAGMNRDDISVYGFVVDGRHYRSECGTRRGSYPACDEMLLPSYSTAKSVFGGLALMRLQKLMPDAAGTSIGSLVDACTGRDWDDVTIENAVDMATGHFLSEVPDADESLAQHVDFLYAEKHADKIAFACRFFPRKATPGKIWVYHSSDTYLAGVAMRAMLGPHREQGSNIYAELVVAPFWQPMHLSPAIMTTRQTTDTAAQPLTGWGLFFLSDDIARIAAWLVKQPAPDGLDEDLFAAAMQRRPHDPGLMAGDPGLRYNNGFWAHDIARYIGCDRPVWVPFMSGYGGISVVLFPNETVYYYFSDGYTQRWREAAIESNTIRNMCQ